MAWSERQHRMLRAMGLRAWSAPLPDDVPDVADVPDPGTGAGEEFDVGEADHPAMNREQAAAAAPAASRLPPVPALADPELQARARHVATLGWPALRDAVADCRACSLCQTRRQTVFGVGHERSRWLVVGEAPGENEDRQGEPFVGAAGQLLDAMLRALKLTRAADDDVPPERRVYIANTLKCRPPGNRNPAPLELQRCEPFLLRQIELLQPAIVLAMGRFAVQSLLNSSESIGKLRGRVHRYQGVPLVVTYHPAYLLRNLPDKARAWEDLCLAARVAEEAEAARAPAGRAPGRFHADPPPTGRAVTPPGPGGSADDSIGRGAP